MDHEQAQICTDTLELLSEIQRQIRKVKECKQGNDVFGIQFPLRKLQDYYPTLQQLNVSCSQDSLKEKFTLLLELLPPIISECERLLEATSAPMHAIYHEKKVIRCGERGRPKISINVEEAAKMRATGMSYTKIAARLKVSYKTVMRHKYLFEDHFSSMTDSDLDDFIRSEKELNPLYGAVYIQGSLLAKKYKVTRARVRERLRHIDPVHTTLHRKVKTKRLVYHVPQPNSLWHWDGNEKVVMYGFYIHGCIDGFSRKIMYLQCATNKKSPTVLKCFQDAAEIFGFPARARCDKGRENIKVAKLMLRKRGLSGCLTGKSTRNVRIERLWRKVNEITIGFKELFLSFVQKGLLDMDDAVDAFCLQYIFRPRIQCALDRFTSSHNFHRVRTALNQTPNEMFDTFHKVPNDVFPDSPSDESNCEDDEIESDTDESQFEKDEFVAVAKECLPNPLDESIDVEDMFVNLRSSIWMHLNGTNLPT